jgi:hypothetical protein
MFDLLIGSFAMALVPLTLAIVGAIGDALADWFAVRAEAAREASGRAYRAPAVVQAY